jgi:RNA polymerase sigma factor (sigma-70 family)
MTDEELMVLGCNGDEKAFKEIYKRHKVRLILYIRRYLGRPNAIAEDLFHDVWENLLKHREDNVSRAKFTTYLYTIARNVVFDYFRRNKVEVAYFRRENGVWALPERGDEAEPEPREEPELYRAGYSNAEYLLIRFLLIRRFRSGGTSSTDYVQNYTSTLG